MLKGLFLLLFSSASLVYSIPANSWLNQKSPSNFDSSNIPVIDGDHSSKPKYGYFYSTKPEIILDDQSVQLFYRTQDHSGVTFDGFDSKSIRIKNSGKYYVSWEIFVQDSNESKNPSFSLYLLENNMECPKILPPLQVFRKKDNLKVTGASIIEVPESGALVQLKNESGFPVTTALDNDSSVSTEGFSATVNLFICEFASNLDENIQSNSYSKSVENQEILVELEATTLKQKKKASSEKINDTLIEGNLVVLEKDKSKVIDIFNRSQFVTSCPFNSTLLGGTNSVIHYRGHKNLQNNLMQEINSIIEAYEDFEQ